MDVKYGVVASAFFSVFVAPVLAAATSAHNTEVCVEHSGDSSPKCNAADEINSIYLLYFFV